MSSRNTPITFDGSASTDPGNAIAGYAWNFGDGSPAGNTAVVTHTYTSAGPFTVTLTVTDAQALTASVSHVIQVLAPTPKSNFQSHVHFAAKLNLAAAGSDTLALSATLNVGTTLVAAGTSVKVVLAGQSFSGTLDSTLKDTSSPNERWQVKTIPGQTGNLLLTLTVTKASLGTAFTTAGAVPGSTNAPVTVSIPVTISVGGQDVPLMINTVFVFGKGGKATASGDGP